MTDADIDMNKVYVVGTGSGDAGQLTGEARDAIAACASFAGGERLLALVPEGASRHVIRHDLGAVREFIRAELENGDVCVLTSGDPGCFSILPYLKEDFTGRLVVVPGIAALQSLAARLAESWTGWELVSLHGRKVEGAGGMGRTMRPTVFFCDPMNSPQVVAMRLLEVGTTGDAVVGAALGGDGEQVWRGSLAEAAAGDYPGNALLLVYPESLSAVLGPETGAAAPGIPDDLWLRHEGIPLSRSEVRAVLLSKARPAGRGVIWDVGSGTGSYGIECALLEPGARVFAIDKKPEACGLIARNATRFGARVETVCGEAPACLADLPRPDLAIIGGNDGRLEEIFADVLKRLNPGGRLAVTAFLEATRKAAHGAFATSRLAGRQATRVTIARGKATQWEEQNPVIIFIGDKQPAGANE